jgi:putative oxidoreductase
MKKINYFSSGTTTTNVDIAALILRIVSGCFMIYGHGYGKFKKFFADEAIEFMDPFGISATATLGLVVFAEFICALFIVFGLMTRWALIPLLITMIYAGFVVHGADGFREKELALFYAAVFLVLLLIGPGKYSMDRWIRKRRTTV